MKFSLASLILVTTVAGLCIHFVTRPPLGVPLDKSYYEYNDDKTKINLHIEYKNNLREPIVGFFGKLFDPRTDGQMGVGMDDRIAPGSSGVVDIEIDIEDNWRMKKATSFLFKEVVTSSGREYTSFWPVKLKKRTPKVSASVSESRLN